MKKRYFNDMISRESIEKMAVCFKPIYKRYSVGERILAYSDNIEKVGIIISGKAKLHYLDGNGDMRLLETYGEGDIFGEMFNLPLEGYEYIVTASEDCQVLYLDYKHVITPCEKTCEHHSQLISNFFIMTAQKSQELSFHLSIINQQTTRKKLMAYLNYIKVSCGMDEDGSFTIPITLGELAEYLCVDRTAMMREIRLMKDERLIKSHRGNFKLL